MTDRRRELIRIMARIEQLMAEAENITVGDIDDEILLRASELVASTNACWPMRRGTEERAAMKYANL